MPDLQQRTLALRTAPRSHRSRLPSHVRRPYARSKDAAVTSTLGRGARADVVAVAAYDPKQGTCLGSRTASGSRSRACSSCSPSAVRARRGTHLSRPPSSSTSRRAACDSGSNLGTTACRPRARFRATNPSTRNVCATSPSLLDHRIPVGLREHARAVGPGSRTLSHFGRKRTGAGASASGGGARGSSRNRGPACRGSGAAARAAPAQRRLRNAHSCPAPMSRRVEVKAAR